jgi:predicted esterase/lysophospholipase L1-like esterase
VTFGSRSVVACLLLLTLTPLSWAQGRETKAAGKKKKETPEAYKPIEDDPTLPRVLLIGDSISVGYTLPTREAMIGIANVHRIPENGGPTSRGLEKIDTWLGDGKWDVIHFNWGLHDLKIMPDGKHQVPLEQYEENLRKLVDRLKSTGADLIWASTTPVPVGKLKPGRSDDDVQRYNAAAEKIMKEKGIAIDDLYAFALPQLEHIQLPSNVHFTKRGSEVLAGKVAQSIEQKLPDAEAGRVSAKSTGFLDKTITDDAGEHKYVVFIPKAYDPGQKWPVILFLHGAGERGDDNRKQVEVGLGPAVRKREAQFPFIAIFPQCEDAKSRPIVGWSPEGPDGQRAIAILEQVEKEYSTDPERIYLTGLSMGGYGTWAAAAKYPDRFAAIVPVCGGGKTEIAPKIAHLPIWCFHGDADFAVPVARSRELIEALKEAGAQPKYTEYPGVGHNSWDAAYGTEELYPWLLSHRRGKPASTK